jgi:GNAT superfamily N-acetyltransferase
MTISPEKIIDSVILQIDNLIDERTRFGEWFYSSPSPIDLAERRILSVYVRRAMRCVSKEIYAQLNGPSALDKLHRLPYSQSAFVATLELANFAVHPDHRRQGIAKGLIDRLVKSAEQHHLYFMIENVENPFLRRYLKKHPQFVMDSKYETRTMPTFYYRFPS